MFVSKMLGTVMVCALSVSGLAACSSSNNNSSETSSKPAGNHAVSAETRCKTTDKWVAVPSNVNTEQLATALGVSPDAMRSGSFGPATCTDAVSEDAISTNQPPIVSVDGQTGPCAIIGMMSAPKPGAMVKQVLAVCPGQSNTSS